MLKKTAYETVVAARDANKIDTQVLINDLFNDFMELHGDRSGKDDPAIISGVAKLGNIPVTVIGTQKGRDMNENVSRHFGCVEPEGYRKALRLMKQSEKFNRPIITLVNTPGAYPGVEAEYHGQGSAIAQCIMEGMRLRVPYLSVIFGEGGSGGALALATGDEVWMFENSIYSILSPEGYASIMWKDAKKVQEASEELGLTPEDLLENGTIDRIVDEVVDQVSADALQKSLLKKVMELKAMTPEDLVLKREQRFRKF